MLTLIERPDGTCVLRDREIGFCHYYDNIDEAEKEAPYAPRIRCVETKIKTVHIPKLFVERK